MKSAKKRIKRGKMPATIKDLARETGLSVATISAYINGEKVREVNREKIENAIAKLGYIRNDYARSLKMRSSKTIGVVVPDMHTKITMHILAEVQNELRNFGYGTIICDSRMDESLEQETFRFMLSKMVDGFIVLPVSGDPAAVDILREKGKPVLVVNSMKERKDVSHIMIRNMCAYGEALLDMIKKGRRHIALIYAGALVTTAKERIDIYRDVLKDAGLYNEKYIFRTEYTIKGGYEALNKALKMYPEIDAFLVSNFEMSLGALTALNQYRENWQKDISFVGIDLEEDAGIFKIRPSSVNRPIKNIGRETARLIVDAVENGRLRDKYLECEYVRGDTL